MREYRYQRPCECGCGRNVGAYYRSQMPRYIAGHSPQRSYDNAWTDAERKALRRMYETDEPIRDIASRLGRTASAVGTMAKKEMRLRRKPRRRLTLAEEFERMTPDRPADGCWIWAGGARGDGYGVTYGDMKAHRASVLLHGGMLPPGLDVLHRCDTKLCVNPAHLYLGTDSDNQIDRAERGGNPKQKLTATQAAEIRKLHATDGLTAAEMGRMYGVHATTIKAILTRRSWSWIDENGKRIA